MLEDSAYPARCVSRFTMFMKQACFVLVSVIIASMVLMGCSKTDGRTTQLSADNKNGVYSKQSDSGLSADNADESAEFTQSNECSVVDYLDRTRLRLSNHDDLYTYDDIIADCDALATMAPGLVSQETVAVTFDGRAMPCLIIGNPQASQKMLVQAGMHAREYITCRLVMEQAVSLIESVLKSDSYGDVAYEDLLNDRAVYLVPCANPDGMTLSQLGKEGLWTSEARAAVDSIVGTSTYLVEWKANARGVDLNRNFDADWASFSGNPVPSSERYKGVAPGSESEAAALIELTEQNRFNRTISYHTAGQVIYWYYKQQGAFRDRSYEYAERISSVTGYPLSANYQVLDPAGYKDWAISKMGIPSLTIEVGSGSSPLPFSQYAAIWQQNKAVIPETLLDIVQNGG